MGLNPRSPLRALASRPRPRVRVSPPQLQLSPPVSVRACRSPVSVALPVWAPGRTRCAGAAVSGPPRARLAMWVSGLVERLPPLQSPPPHTPPPSNNQPPSCNLQRQALVGNMGPAETLGGHYQDTLSARWEPLRYARARGAKSRTRTRRNNLQFIIDAMYRRTAGSACYTEGGGFRSCPLSRDWPWAYLAPAYRLAG